MKTNIGLVDYAKSKLNLPTIYFLSGFGRVLTESAIQRRIDKNDEFTIDNLTVTRSGIGKYAFDCVGLIKGYLWEESPGVVDYNIPSGSDQNSQMMYDKAVEKGLLATMPDIKGMLVFTADLGHVGIYVGKINGIRQYIECTPAWNAWGVTTSADSGNQHTRKWTYWGKYHLIEYLQEQPLQMLDIIGKQYQTSANVRIRELPTTNSTILGELPANVIVPITQISQETRDGYLWVKLSYNGRTGYCAVISEATVNDVSIIVEEPVKNDPDSDIVETPIVIEPVEPEPDIFVPVVVEPEPTPIDLPVDNTNLPETTHKESANALYKVLIAIIQFILELFKGK